MARRALMLREGIAPIRDRLLTTLFLAALLHGAHHPRPHLQRRPRDAPSSAPGLEVLLVSDELPERDTNPNATYLAQRTQVGSGNTRKSVAPRNRARRVPRAQARRHAPTATRCGDAGEHGRQPRRARAHHHRLEHAGALPRRRGRRRRHRETGRCSSSTADATARARRRGRSRAARGPAARRAVGHARHARGDAGALPRLPGAARSSASAR